MKYVIDHDYHLHSFLSPCGGEAAKTQTIERILQYGEENGLKELCLTDHFWDSAVKPTGGCNIWKHNDYARNSSVRPLPQTEKVRFFFGCEAEMDSGFQLGLSPQVEKEMDFIIIPTTHMHLYPWTMAGDAPLEERAVLFTHRLDEALDVPYPDGKVGIAHLITSLIAPNQWTDHLRVLEMIPDSVFVHQFKKAKARNFGIEVNLNVKKYAPEEQQSALRPLLIAKECGCKFYLGSDAHLVSELEGAMERLSGAVDALDLTEDDKFRPFVGI